MNRYIFLPQCGFPALPLRFITYYVGPLNKTTWINLPTPVVRRMIHSLSVPNKYLACNIFGLSSRVIPKTWGHSKREAPCIISSGMYGWLRIKYLYPGYFNLPEFRIHFSVTFGICSNASLAAAAALRLSESISHGKWTSKSIGNRHAFAFDV